MEIETWKNEVLNSLQGMQRAAPNPFLFTRIEKQVRHAQNVPRLSLVPASTISAVAAGLLILVAINIALLTSFSQPKKAQNNPSSYSLTNSNYQLY